MWEWALVHDGLFFILALVTLLVIRDVCERMARTVSALGARHCASCACHVHFEEDVDEDSSG
jgi:hypothetical protein